MKKLKGRFLNFRFKTRYLIFSVLTLFSSGVFATCTAGDQLCAAQASFTSNFGPTSTVVYIILGGGAIGTLITALTTHNYKPFLTVVAAFLFVTVIFTII